MNAGVMYEKAKQPEKAADIYLELAEKYGDKNPDIGEKAAFTAGAVYEKVIYYDKRRQGLRATCGRKFRTGIEVGRRAVQRRAAAPGARPEQGGDRALPGVREEVPRAQGRRRTSRSTSASSTRRPATTARRTRRTRDYTKIYRSTGKRDHRGVHARRADVVQARPAQARQGGLRHRAASCTRRRTGPRRRPATTWAAEARYYEGELIFREYEKVTLDVKPAQLERALKKKSKLLAEAEKVVPVGRRVPGPQVGDGGAVSRRPGLRRVRRVAASTRRRRRASARSRRRPTATPSTSYVVDIQDKAIEPVHRGLPEGDPDAGLRRVHREDPRGARPAGRRQVPARSARPASKERIGDRPPDPRARDRGGQVTAARTCAGRRGRRARRRVQRRSSRRPDRPQGRPATSSSTRSTPRPPREFEAAMRALRLGGPEASETAKAAAQGGARDRRQAVGGVARPRRARVQGRRRRGGGRRVQQGARDQARSHADAARAAPRPAARAGHKKEARADYEAALRATEEDDPARRDAAARLASLLRDFGDFDDAVVVLRDTVRLSGINAQIYTELGLIYIQQKRARPRPARPREGGRAR